MDCKNCGGECNKVGSKYICKCCGSSFEETVSAPVNTPSYAPAPPVNNGGNVNFHT